MNDEGQEEGTEEILTSYINVDCTIGKIKKQMENRGEPPHVLCNSTPLQQTKRVTTKGSFHGP